MVATTINAAAQGLASDQPFEYHVPIVNVSNKRMGDQGKVNMVETFHLTGKRI